MKHYEQVTYEISQLIVERCDICNELMYDRVTDYDGGSTSAYISYDRLDGKSFHPSLCPKCMETKVIPFLASLGVPIEFKEEEDICLRKRVVE